MAMTSPGAGLAALGLFGLAIAAILIYHNFDLVGIGLVVFIIVRAWFRLREPGE
jgi:hypothetical protein